MSNTAKQHVSSRQMARLVSFVLAIGIVCSATAVHAEDPGERTAEEAAEAALKVGDNAIDGELVDGEGNKVRLSELWKEGPLVVVWYRGGWCPICQRHLSGIQQALPKIKEAGGQVVAISPELPKKAKQTTEKHELEYLVLSDPGNQLASKYGVVFRLGDETARKYQEMFDLIAYNGDDSMRLPIPVAYVINQQGEITYAFVEADYKKRADPAQVIEALQKSPPAK